MKRNQAGFTLTEMMVVVAIIGVLVTLAIVYMRPRVRPIDVANRIGDLVHDAGRRAVALGPAPANVVVALSTKARTQILAVDDGTTVTFTLYKLDVTGPTTGVWNPIVQYKTDKNVQAVQYRNDDQSNVPPMQTNWTSGAATPPTSGFYVLCYPDGNCTPRTLFFQATISVPPNEYQAKLTIFKLAGSVATRADWN